MPSSTPGPRPPGRGPAPSTLWWIAGVLALALTVAGWVFLRSDDEPDPAPASPPTPTVTPTPVHRIDTTVTLQRPEGELVAGRRFTVTGSVTQDGDGEVDGGAERRVRLQVARGQGFENIATTTVDAQGAFTFTDVALGAGTVRLRAHVPGVRSEDGDTITVWKRGRSQPLRGLTVREVSVTATALPPVAQPGTQVAAVPSGATVSAEFAPATPGAPARLQRQTAQGWKTVDRARQDRAGWAVFTAPVGDTYRVTGPDPNLPGGPASNAVTATAWRVDFAEDFSGTALDTSRWLQEVSGYTPTGKRTCSAADASALRVADGKLAMGVRLNPHRLGQTCTYAMSGNRTGTHPFMYNTQINTRGKYVFRYGVAAARMKLQRARGMHSAFWLLPENWELPPGNPAGGTEVDIVEWFGHNPAARANSISSYIHYMDAAGKRVKLGDPTEAGYRTYVDLLIGQDEDWWDAYHVFSVEWTPHAYVFRVDGKEYYREPRAIMHTPAYVSLSMLIGDYELKNLTEAGRNDTADVDWVRIYQQ